MKGDRRPSTNQGRLHPMMRERGARGPMPKGRRCIFGGSRCGNHRHGRDRAHGYGVGERVINRNALSSTQDIRLLIAPRRVGQPLKTDHGLVAQHRVSARFTPVTQRTLN